MIEYLNAELTENTLQQLARNLMIAMQTAPKGCGVNTLDMIAVWGDEKEQLAIKMEEIAKRDGKAFFLRDAENVRQSSVILFVGTDSSVRKLNCGYCGYEKCSQKPSSNPCVFNAIDLGIALGSGASSAMDYKIDNRILYSVGKAAKELSFFKENIQMVFAIPLSATEKSIFFDREPM